MTPQELAFAPTRWTLVLRARGTTAESRGALAELCDAYWQPVFAFMRRETRAGEDARDLTQGFFASLLARDSLGQVDPTRGRFRSYLLGAARHYAADHRDRERRQKRGGGVDVQSLEAGPTSDTPHEALQVAAPNPVPDAWFDREWALNLMRRSLEKLENVYAQNHKPGHFQTLKPWLAGDTPSLSQAEAARQLGLSEGAVKVAIHRLRQRHRDALRQEIAQTLLEGDDIDAELRYLIEALAAA